MTRLWSRKWSLLALVLGAGLLIAGVAYDRQSTMLQADDAALAPSPTTVAAPATAAPMTFAVLGDSYSEGVGATPGRGWVDLVAAQMCWSLTNRSAQGGKGYTTAGDEALPDFATFVGRVPAVAGGAPKVTILPGGNHGAGGTPEEITPEATNVFNSLRTALGQNAEIVAIGPIPTPMTESPALAPVSAAIGAAAAQFGVEFIDPVAEAWLSDPSFFAEDGIQPNDQGYAEFAARLEADLRARGLQSAPACGAQ